MKPIKVNHYFGHSWIIWPNYKKQVWTKIANIALFILLALAGLTILLPGIIWNIRNY